MMEKSSKAISRNRALPFDDAESPLALLRQRRDANGAPMIGEAQYLAGERLRADYTEAHMEQRVTSNWQRGAPGSRGNPDHLGGKALAARQRLYAALDAVGPELTTILLEICCLAAGLEQAERRLGLPRRSGKAVLDLALTRLARHYGLLAPIATASRHPMFRHWAQPDFRPAISA